MKVLIIDDQRLFADGIRKLMNDHDPCIITEYAGNIFSANENINSIDPPNLILLGINDKATANSYDLIVRLNQLHIDIPVMIISNTDSSVAAAMAIENNASGFITKSCRRETTLNAILSVLKGELYIRKSKQQSAETSIKVADSEKVTLRQQQVLFLLSKGLLNKQIANELDISANTVKAHLHDLFRRLHVKNRTAAVLHGYKNGLI